MKFGAYPRNPRGLMPLSVRPYPQILALLLCGLCSACGIMNNQFAADLVSPAEVNETTGLIILSVGAPESCSTGHFVQIQNFDKPYNATPRAYLSVTSYVFKSDFRDHHGHLYVVKLAPGKYYLAPRVTGPITYSTNPPGLILNFTPMRLPIWVSSICHRHVDSQPSWHFVTRRCGICACSNRKTPPLKILKLRSDCWALPVLSNGPSGLSNISSPHPPPTTSGSKLRME